MLEKQKKYLREYSYRQHFGGFREIAIQRDKQCCVRCGMTRKQHQAKWGRDITVDHIDGRGRYSTEKNHHLDNLQTMCVKCHAKKDRLQTRERMRLADSGIRGVRQIGKKWRAEIRVNSKTVHLGYWKSKLAAALVYKLAFRRYHIWG